MNAWILDTDTLTLFQQGHPPLVQRCAQASSAPAITVISVEEQLSGWYKELRKAKRPDRLAWAYRRLTSNVAFLSQLTIHTFDEVCIRRYESLAKLRLKIGIMDLRIAAIALERDATLVTRNVRDFQRVPELRVENWAE
jgi:tRNA(fMet)-specific endonuclease VapC